jgi:reverse gyrase
MVSPNLHCIFRGGCPNCGGDISDLRLIYGLPCDSCLPGDRYIEYARILSRSKLRRIIVDELRRNGKLKRYASIADLEGELEHFEEVFYRGTGSKLLSIQRSWAKQVFKGRSIAIVAPTGMGKTSFGIALLAYFALKGMKSYMILPTSLLARQVYSRIISFIERSGYGGIKVAAYHSLMTEKEAREMYERIHSMDFDILVTTSTFLSRKFDLIRDAKFDVVFVDDVDSFLRTSKNVDRVLKLLGFPDEVIEAGYKIIDARRRFKKALTSRSGLEDARSEVEKLESIIIEFLEKYRPGILVVSGASVRAKRSKRVMLFRELLNFELGGRFELLRNVEDLYVERRRSIEEDTANLVAKLGGGGLIFVPMDMGSAYAEKLTDYLRSKGVKAYAYVKPRRRILEEFVSGVYDVLVGVASFRSPLARGIDLPQRIRYAIFAGVPKIRIDLGLEGFKPRRVMILLSHLRDYVADDEKMRIDYYVATLRRYISMISVSEGKLIEEAIARGDKLDGFLGRIQDIYEEAAGFARKLIGREDVRKALEESPRLVLEGGERPTLIVPDPVGYIQGSGRTSRLYSRGLSKGLSIVIVDERKAFNGLMEEVSWYIDDVRWRHLESVDLDSILRQIDEERDYIARLTSGKVEPGEVKDIVTTALLLVESPNKAKTIARFFGRPLKKRVGSLTVYEVDTGTGFHLNITASGGHIYDLVTDVGYHGVIVEDGRYIPVYGSLKRCPECGEQYTDEMEICPRCDAKLIDKATIVESLREASTEVDVVFVGTDADSEGEKIGWDTACIVSPYTSRVSRVEFHEITRRAILEALSRPREFDQAMVEAQLLRRIEDRWIGFELSSRVQKAFGKSTLSAGRVQTVVLGWVVDRYDKARASIKDFFRVTLENGLTVVLEKPKMERKRVDELVAELKRSEAVVELDSLEEVEVKPYPPFSTDTMLAEATSSLKLSADDVMNLAQELFEMGLITYHRTDSVRVSDVGRSIAQRYLEDRFGSRYVDLFKPRVWSMEGAHECIRPTRPIDTDRLKQLTTLRILTFPRTLTKNHYMLYKLIFDRFIASQMKEAKVIKARYRVRLLDETLEGEGYIKVIDPGFTIIKPLTLLPERVEGRFKVVDLQYWRGTTVKFHTESDLVRLMKERGIGRPSTYAKVISTLFKRGYVIQLPRGYIIPTSLGRRTYEYLYKGYARYVSEETTRRLEEAMKAVEEGSASYLDILKELEVDIRSLAEYPAIYQDFGEVK